MTHLSTAALARLVDEEPDATEAAHLAACAECAAERHALAEQTGALGALGVIAPREQAWDSLAHELRSAGLIQQTPPRRSWLRPALGAAAALLVVAGGGAALAFRPGAAPAPAPLALEQRNPVEAAALPEPPAAASTLPVAPQSGYARPAPLEPAELARAEPRAAPAPRAPSPAPPPGQVERSAEQAYLLALAEYIGSMAPAADADAVERLAAWEGIVLATGDALERAPASPAVNGYHLLALRERDNVLRQVAVNTSLAWF